MEFYNYFEVYITLMNKSMFFVLFCFITVGQIEEVTDLPPDWMHGSRSLAFDLSVQLNRAIPEIIYNSPILKEDGYLLRQDWEIPKLDFCRTDWEVIKIINK